MDRITMAEANRRARSVANPELREAIDMMKGQLLIVLVNRLGSEVRIPVSEVDDTGGWLLNMEVEGQTFVFRTERKN